MKEWFGIYHKAEAFPYTWLNKEKQAEEEFEYELLSSAQGSGETESDDPETFEHSQVVGEEELELMDKEMLKRQMEVKGDSSMPTKRPAIVTFVPITSLIVI